MATTHLELGAAAGPDARHCARNFYPDNFGRTLGHRVQSLALQQIHLVERGTAHFDEDLALARLRDRCTANVHCRLIPGGILEHSLHHLGHSCVEKATKYGVIWEVSHIGIIGY